MYQFSKEYYFSVLMNDKDISQNNHIDKKGQKYIYKNSNVYKMTWRYPKISHRNKTKQQDKSWVNVLRCLQQHSLGQRSS